MGWMKDETGLDRNAANYVPLSPLSFLRRAVQVFPGHEAVVYGPHRKTYAEYADRVTRLASALVKLGVKPGEVVATLLPNIPAQAEAHFGVPACGAVLNTINTRLEADTVAYILDHGEARVLLCDPQFLPMAAEAIERMEGAAPIVIEVADDHAGVHAHGHYMDYEALLETGDPDFEWIMPEDEWESIALNYTSGTTGRPKGVVYHHRGAYLNAMGQVISWRMTLYPKYLTIVPLFHCNGWCHTWMMPLVGGTLICCRDIAAKPIFDAIADEGATHFGGAPIVLNALINAPEAERRTFDHVVEVFTAGAPPAPATLAKIEPMGFNVTHVYGLTETYGPATECTWQGEWDGLLGDDRAAVKSRQGVAMPFMEPVQLWDDHNNPVPMDGKTQGEIVFRGNGVMKGYLKNPTATAEAFAGGYYHSGDIAVQHPNTYLQISDRAKDIIISGGENISSVEVEGVLMGHPDVLLCAVVAKPDDKWGEVPCAFVELKDGHDTDEAALIAYARERLAGFKTPKHVVFQELPKTSTGKIQKFQLRGIAKEL
ncbi:AMP-binding protein [Lutimaribacter sp. EGI FJ00015]|uniref:AMP-binding protein n=1 Tax=Lutimaribacter degradans TaxID=2945989 RepID=A0ACC5ZXF2_9RHOB|nr:AMP-binding protein [Lutimaribacter sp. EGI FJ00013]MCM2563033.1 AMP-binding protein [Lutimaribacter sp. EGI FJ00013]MCO0614201.1 AMP-binding protein [Lutimaribacter sp. EGI FJ00015]MCO0636178.1 AMP-binding protein [Lutimaribacter sp. EGI FJ00014]